MLSLKVKGCSISMASAPMMTKPLKVIHSGEAMQMGPNFTKMMLSEDYVITEEMGDIEALQVYLNPGSY